MRRTGWRGSVRHFFSSPLQQDWGNFVEPRTSERQRLAEHAEGRDPEVLHVLLAVAQVVMLGRSWPLFLARRASAAGVPHVNDVALPAADLAQVASEAAPRWPAGEG